MKARTKILVAVGSLVVVLAGFAGVAYAADGAIPGDTLYGLDCALEGVGIGDGGLQERLQEAEQLCVNGDLEAGLNHAAVAVANQAGLDQGGQGQANGALHAAANAVQAFNQGDSEQIRARVAEMLQWMAQTEAQGEDFGQGVAERAREIAGAAEQTQSQEQEQAQEQNQYGEQNQNQNGQLYQNRNGATDDTE